MHEYRVHSITFDDFNALAELLTERAEDNWELVQLLKFTQDYSGRFFDAVAIFKRQKSD